MPIEEELTIGVTELAPLINNTVYCSIQCIVGLLTIETLSSDVAFGSETLISTHAFWNYSPTSMPRNNRKYCINLSENACGRCLDTCLYVCEISKDLEDGKCLKKLCKNSEYFEDLIELISTHVCNLELLTNFNTTKK